MYNRAIQLFSPFSFFRSGLFRPSRFLKKRMNGNGQTLAKWL
jgi:hypothetical protein